MITFSVSYSTPVFGVDPDRLAAFARHVEACGFEGMYVPEHVALYPGATFGGHPVPTTLPYGDPLELLLFAAAATERLLLGTGVLLLPYHHPVVLAKRLATVDRLSKGRLRLLTVGLGSLPGEAAAMGVDFASRGRRADEAIDVLRLLMTGDEEGVSFDGEFFAFDSLCSFPQPAAPLPIHVGGSSAAAARRAGRRGDGWFPGGLLSPQERRAQLAIARSAAEEAGRDPSALQYTRWGSSTMTEETLERLQEEGVTRVVVGGTEDELERFAGRFIGRASSG
ncbi:TIGR03619 family F420-dependent LLM class oxidoreductase [Dactylosporangium matsuzakiense]|uniref:LLM class F420-dependent oxidoreductase n=1 Tax=Dactylosporangium matsuzakiense TaxID=53360 RepID=A0A9W6KVH9_9ACTN|nr:TIGR03619 family F420-dependent LLM class oxidoreductase [Dactylosporangium matsuzakiense]UWZ47855.1 TIGR03619 family F420-dependent LLM class oxidoreductase [Dactylosporangium matsuzakiense]GLL07972.1 LLM class F420-dependent oxidoreductase [Dactylosporangium matsuzakiense]